MTPQRPWRAGWRFYQKRGHSCWYHERLPLMVISDVGEHDTFGRCYHVSVSTISVTLAARRRPADDECEAVRRAFSMGAAVEDNGFSQNAGVRHFWLRCEAPS